MYNLNSHEMGCVSDFFFYENLVAASVECSSRIVEVARWNEISQVKKISLLRFVSSAHKMVTDDDL